MPRLTRPPGMPQEVLAIIDVLGNLVRTEILRRLSIHPLTALELADEMEVAHSSVHRHLVKLEQNGLVTTDTKPGHRRGQNVLWRTIPEKVAELGQTWIKYATGQGQ